MIDAIHWKKELQRRASHLAGYPGRVRLNHTSACRLERLLMESFYLLHKLMEDHRIDDHLADLPVSVKVTPSAGRTHYLADPGGVVAALPPTLESATFRLAVVANKIIHSYLILPVINRESGLGEVVVCSEFENFDQLLVIPLQQLIELLKTLD